MLVALVDASVGGGHTDRQILLLLYTCEGRFLAQLFSSVFVFRVQKSSSGYRNMPTLFSDPTRTDVLDAVCTTTAVYAYMGVVYWYSVRESLEVFCMNEMIIIDQRCLLCRVDPPPCLPTPAQTIIICGLLTT